MFGSCVIMVYFQYRTFVLRSILDLRSTRSFTEWKKRKSQTINNTSKDLTKNSPPSKTESGKDLCSSSSRSSGLPIL